MVLENFAANSLVHAKTVSVKGETIILFIMQISHELCQYSVRFFNFHQIFTW